MTSNNVQPQARLFWFNVPGIAPTLAVPFEQLIGVARLPSATRIPAMPSAILGLSRWQDQPAVILDLAQILAPAETAAGLQDFLTYHHLILKIVFENQVNLLACPILPGGQVISVPMWLPRISIPDGIASEAVHQGVLIGDNPVLLLDTMRLPGLLLPLQLLHTS